MAISKTPVRYPSGVSTFLPNQLMSQFPTLPTQFQVTKGDDFIPFRQSTDYTATTSGTGATAAAYSWNGGAVKVTAGSTSTFKSFEALGANSLLAVPGNQLWHDIRLAVPVNSTGVTVANPANDSVVYCGFFDNVDPTAASNGIYFTKAASSTSISFVVLKNGTATTFQNIGDFSEPSGLYNDPNASNGALTFNGTGTTFSSVAVATPGNGYRVAPLIITKGTAGSGAQVYCQLGSSYGYPQVPMQGRGSSLFAPYILAAGSGYTAGTLGADIIPWINLQFYYDGKGSLLVGVNNNPVVGFRSSGGVTVAAGNTYNIASVGNQFNCQGTNLSTSVSPIQQPDGDVYPLLPQVPLQLAFGLVGSSGNNRSIYVEEVNMATELN